MSQEAETGEPLSMEELADLLAEETATDPDEFARQAEEFDIGSPEEAETVSE
ncbi:hypothetical protein [Halosimplex marinum]|uniref:hypothetical protein n=1 Tax=Halosimplex marinum TaxID=3396620 RepID=UPI003F57D3E8